MAACFQLCLLAPRIVIEIFLWTCQTLWNKNGLHRQEIFCVVEGGQNLPHPFRRIRDAISGEEDWSSTHSPWSNRFVFYWTVVSHMLILFSSLHVTYRAFIPPIEVSTSKEDHQVCLRFLARLKYYQLVKLVPATLMTQILWNYKMSLFLMSRNSFGQNWTHGWCRCQEYRFYPSLTPMILPSAEAPSGMLTISSSFFLVTGIV